MVAPFLYRHAYPIIYLLVLFCLLLLLVQPLWWEITLPKEFWVRQLTMFLLWSGMIYLNIRVLVTRLLFQNKTGLFVLSLLALVLASLAADMLLSHALNLHELFHRALNPNAKSIPPRGLGINPFQLLITLMVLGISTAIKAVQKLQRDQELQQQLEKQKVSSELSFLKAQINPHFFFNTLHSIYALTHINVETAREALYTLSRMMRYVLYETQNGTTLLSKELEFLQDYIQLMQLRLTDKMEIRFDKPASIQDDSVAPMLFLPFVENAFKHGISTTHKSHIHIGLQQENKEIIFKVCNSLLPDKRVVLEESSGIGLVNTRRRLDLLYPNKYTLQIQDHTPGGEYEVLLSIDLS